MKLKRILSLLLSAVLVISGLPVTAFAAGAAGSSGAGGFAGLSTSLSADDWTAGTGGAITLEDEGAGTTASYIRVSAGDSHVGVKYTDTSVQLVKHNTQVYKITLKARITPSENIATGTTLTVRPFVCGGSGAPSTQDWDTTNILAAANCLSKTGDFGNQVMNLSTDWKEFTILFRPPSNIDYLKLSFERRSAGLGFDIDLISLVQVVSTNPDVPISNELLKDDFTLYGATNLDASSYTKPTITKVEKDKYLSADMSAATDTKICSNDDTVLAAGIYSISGSFRLAAAGTLTASANSASIGSVAIGTEWTNAEFILNLESATSLKNIGFAFDAGATILDFKNFEYEKDTAADNVIALINAIGEVTLDDAEAIANAEAAYAELTEVQKALVTNYATLTAARATYDQLAADAVDALIAAIGEVTLASEAAIEAAEAAYEALTSAQKDLVANKATLDAAKAALNALMEPKENDEWKIDDESVYTHYDVATGGSYLHIPATTEAVKGGITFRQDDTALSSSSTYKLTFKARNSVLGSGTNKLTLGGWYGATNLGSVTLTDEWKEYEIDITNVNQPRIVISFIRTAVGGTYLPFDIDTFSVVDDSTGAELVTTADAVTSWHASENAWTVKWYSDNLALQIHTAVESASFIRADASEATDTKVYSNDTTTLSAGLYNVSGSFRLGKFGTATLTAYANGGAIGTAEISNEWTDAEFTLQIDNDTSLADLGFALDAGATILDFKNFECEKDTAADNVIALIDAIGEVTLESEAAIEAAEEAYEALNAAQKALVGNKATLDAARATYNQLAAEAVEVLIAAIGEVTLDSLAAIEAAEAAYEALNAAQKALVENKATLDAAKATYNQLAAPKEDDKWANDETTIYTYYDVADGGSYIHVPATTNIQVNGITFRQDDTALSSSSAYTLTFKARNTLPNSGANTLTLYGWYGTNLGSVALTDEWKEYEVQITNVNQSRIVIGFFRTVVNGTYLPFDIDGLSIVDNSTGVELVTTADAASNWHASENAYTVYWQFDIHKVVESIHTTIEADFFTRADVSEADNTTIYSIDGTLLEAGRYYISGSFRLGEYDFGANGTGTLTVWANGEQVDTLALNTEWQDARFVLDIPEATTLADIGFSFDAGKTVLDYKNFKCELAFPFYEDLTTNNGTPIFVVDEADGTTDSYIHVSGGNHTTGLKYTDTATSLTAGTTYRLTFKARATAHKNIDALTSGRDGRESMALSTDIRPFIHTGKKSGDNFDWDKIEILAPANRLALSDNIGADEQTVRALNLTDEWQEFSIEFQTPNDVDFLKLSFGRRSYADDILGFDIDALSLVDTATGAELIKNDFSKYAGTSFNDSTPKPTVTLVDKGIFYRADAPQTGVTELRWDKDELLAAGRYQISAAFRLNEYDFANSGSDTLRAFIADSQLLTANGANYATITTEWKNVVFELDLIATDLKYSDLVFMLGSNSALEVKDISYVLVEKRISMSDIDTGTLITLLMLKRQEAIEIGYNAPWKANGENLTSVNGILNESTGTVGGEDAPAFNSYIHAYNRDNNMDRIVYENKDATLAPGTYTLSFYARTADYTNPMAATRNTAALLRMFIGNDRTTQVPRISSSKSGPSDPRNVNNLMLKSEWTLYSFTFKLTEETPFVFSLEGSGAGYGWCPIDIDGFKVVACNSAGAPITGENLAVNSDLLMGTKNSGWSAVAIDKKGVTVAAEVLTESLYQLAEIPAADKNIITSTAYVDIEPGKYYLTTKVRLGNIDFAKYGMGATADTLLNDGNKANLSAVLEGVVLKTTDDVESITVTPEWKTVTFVAEVEEAIPMKKLKMVLDAPYSLEFDFINFGTEIDEEDADMIAKPTFDADGNAILPPLPAITEGNLLDGLMKKSRSAYWSYGDQTLELKTDENGETYFAASNITHYNVGFTYKPGYKLSAGEYKFSAMVRTSTPGETTLIRAIINGKSGSAYVTNEWRLVEFAFEVKEDSELIFKMCGGPRLTCVQNYDFKNIRLYDINYVPTGENLTTGGDFENPLNGTAGWSPAYSSGGKVTRKTDADGNSYLNVSERPESHYPAALDLGFTAQVGDTFKISYDIRTAIEGEEMTVRAYLGSIATGGTGLNVSEPYSDANPVRYVVTNEWRHVEHTYTATKAEEFILQIKGGPSAEENNDFDIDNVVIMKTEVEKVDPAKHYTTGHFDDEATALSGWKIGWGTGTTVWNKEGDNGYITAKGRGESIDPLYFNGGFVTIPGVTYKISYDIRTSNDGETIRIRPYFGTLAVVRTELTVNPVEIEGMPGRYWITNEWKHVEHTYTAGGYETFAVQIGGGPGADENKDFDVDNFKVEIVH